MTWLLLAAVALLVAFFALGVLLGIARPLARAAIVLAIGGVAGTLIWKKAAVAHSVLDALLFFYGTAPGANQVIAATLAPELAPAVAVVAAALFVIVALGAAAATAVGR